MYNMKELKNQDQLNELLLYKRIVEWDKDKLVLDDGLVVELECTDSSCSCVTAYGEFKDVKLDAVITNVIVGNEEDVLDDRTEGSRNTVTIFHNQNEIAVAEMLAESDESYEYYSVGSIVIGDCYYPFVEAGVIW